MGTIHPPEHFKKKDQLDQVHCTDKVGR